MDVCETETARPPLVPSEKNNAAILRKPRAKEISSRYMSGITSASLSTPRRSQSPSFVRGGATPGNSVSKRAQSAERRRPTTPSRPSTPLSPSRPLTPSFPSRPSTPVQDSAIEMQTSSRRSINGRTPEGLWPSMRSLSVSFQSDTFSLPVTKKERPVSDHTLKPSANVAHRQAGSPARKAVTPERKRTPRENQTENSRPIENSHAKLVDHHRWPSRTGGKVSTSFLTRSVDLTDKVFPKGASLSLPGRGISPVRRPVVPDATVRSIQKSSSEVARKVNFDGTGGVEHESSSVSDLRETHKLIASSPSEAGFLAVRPSRTLSSPLPLLRHHLPTKVTSPTARGMLSPSRTRPCSPFTSASSVTSISSSMSSVLSFTADLRKGKKGANHLEDAHQLRLLYNRYLQWRFVNARADTAMAIQKIMAEDLLYNVWNTTSELRDSVTGKRIILHQLRQDIKLDTVLREQMSYLEGWALIDREHSISLSGAIDALETCTLRLPVIGGARADVQMVKDAICSAVDVMQAMGSSICSLLSRVEGMNSLVSQLAKVATQERAMLDECGDLLASMAGMQVEESDLRTHLIQLKQAI